MLRTRFTADRCRDPLHSRNCCTPTLRRSDSSLFSGTNSSRHIIDRPRPAKRSEVRARCGLHGPSTQRPNSRAFLTIESASRAVSMRSRASQGSASARTWSSRLLGDDNFMTGPIPFGRVVRSTARFPSHSLVLRAGLALCGFHFHAPGGSLVFSITYVCLPGLLPGNDFRAKRNLCRPGEVSRSRGATSGRKRDRVCGAPGTFAARGRRRIRCSGAWRSYARCWRPGRCR